MMLIGLREALGSPVTPKWRKLLGKLALAGNGLNTIAAQHFDTVLRSERILIQVNEFRAILTGLGVVADKGDAVEVDYDRAEAISSALSLLDEEPADESPQNRWRLVATVPFQSARGELQDDLLLTGPLILSLIESANDELWIASPFMDDEAVALMANPLGEASRRGVHIKILTTEQNAEKVLTLIEAMGQLGGTVFAWTGQAPASVLGSHAKAVIADQKTSYIGSANVTSFGLAKHFEIGVQLDGPGVRAIATLLEIASRQGRLVSPPSDRAIERSASSVELVRLRDER